MQFQAPESIESAVTLLANASGEARILAGGTDLLVQLRAGMISPQLVIDLKNVEEARRITAEHGGFRIGAAVAGAELSEHPDVKKAWSGVVEAVDLIGSTQIQGRASMGGNLCNASPAADSVPAMIAARATCQVVGPNGSREMPVEDVCTGPGQTSLAKGEIVVSIFLPARESKSSDAYLRFIPRTEMDIAVVGVGIHMTLDTEGVCSDARVAVGAVAPTVLLVGESAAALVGTTIDDAAIENMMAAVRDSCDPINDKRGTVAYRTQVAGVLAGRVCRIALERARGNQ